MNIRLIFLTALADILFSSLMATSNAPRLAPWPIVAKGMNKEGATFLKKRLNIKYVPLHMQRYIAQNFEYLEGDSLEHTDAQPISAPRNCTSPSQEKLEAFANALDMAVKIQNQLSSPPVDLSEEDQMYDEWDRMLYGEEKENTK